MIRECGSVVFARRGCARRAGLRGRLRAGQLAARRGFLRRPARPSGSRSRGRSGDRARPAPRGSAPADPGRRTTRRAARHRARSPNSLVLGRIELASASARISAGQAAQRVAVGEERRVRRDLGAVDRDHPGVDQPGLHAQRQHLPEQRRRSRPGDGAGTGPAWRDPDAGSRPAPDTRHPRPDAARSAARTAPRCNTRTPTPPASSPGHTPRRPGHRPGTRHRTPPDPARRPRQARSTPDGPQAANPAPTAASRYSCSRSPPRTFTAIPHRRPQTQTRVG